jgi:aspartate-semialdehyde dehydrogenase
MEERAGQTASNPAYAHPIDLNVLPHIDVFQPNGYTKEELKMVNETKKIMSDDSIRVTATCVRVPVMGGHSESVNVEFAQDFDLEDVRDVLRHTDGVELVDDVQNNNYPMPKDSHGRDAVLVGRLRRDETQPNTLNMWIVADNLRKGAATNAVQIAEYLVANGLV